MLKLDQIVILIVDDDDEIRKLMIEYLTHFGFRNFLQSKNGTEAYRLIADETQQVDLIISDWEMPNLSGIDLLNAVRSNKEIPQAPFIFLTKEADMTNVWKAIDSGVSSYIVKPLAPGVLKKKMEDVFKKFKA